MKRILAVLAASSWGVVAVTTSAYADTATPPPSSTAPAPAPATTSPQPTTTNANGCATGALPPVVDGQPSNLKSGAAAGDYIWHDANGWHLAVTHPGNAKVVFTGRITTSRPMTYRRVRDEKNDITKLSKDGEMLTFRFTNYGHIDGVDFGADCAKRVNFTLQSGGHQLDPTDIFLGASNTNPTSNPFTIERS